MLLASLLAFSSLEPALLLAQMLVTSRRSNCLLQQEQEHQQQEQQQERAQGTWEVPQQPLLYLHKH